MHDRGDMLDNRTDSANRHASAEIHTSHRYVHSVTDECDHSRACRFPRASVRRAAASGAVFVGVADRAPTSRNPRRFPVLLLPP